ncbi:13475_t:CDS:2 [Funneliformis caledonium]|uniref:13475_t:CDS:1 n=1 Tax=Funneliformis caledonium TaxID=1117310 RepID=A0A9N9EXV0_9GLOM|nr:13475_t:CDS:2 [Funneliformis caledonium]
MQKTWKEKNNNTTGTLSSSATSSLRDILNATSPKDQDLNVKHHDILPNLPSPYIQIPISEINKLDNLAVNIKKDWKKTSKKKYGKENQDMMYDEQSLVHDLINLNTAVHVSPARLSTKIAEKTPESQQQSAKSKKKIPEKSVSKILKASISFSTAIYNEGIKRKKLKVFDDSQIKHIKINSNAKFILEKIVEEQLKQCIIINTLQESNYELKYEIFENRKLLQNILTILTSGSLITINKLMQQEEKLKQRLKRKDTKYMWWDVINKNPSDSDIEQAFKLQVQMDCSQKM